MLQEYGGFYIDLDIECVRPLDFLARYPVVLPKTWPVGLSNDFMAAEAGHPFMRSLVDALPGWSMNLWLKYPTVMFSTGPMLVTLRVWPPPVPLLQCLTAYMSSASCMLCVGCVMSLLVRCLMLLAKASLVDAAFRIVPLGCTCLGHSTSFSCMLCRVSSM